MSALQKKLVMALALALVMQAGFNLARYLGELDAAHRFGGDFICFWQAAVRTRHGDFAAIYDPALWRRTLAAPGAPTLAWYVYPPFSLFGLQLLGGMTYAQAAAWWSLVPLPAYFALLAGLARRAEADLAGEAASGGRLGWPGCAALGALTLPFLGANLFSGQTGAIVAVLLLAAAWCWRDRPLLAGVFIGLLAVKPQLGLLAPFALAAAGRWRTVAAAAATIAVLVAASLAWVGPQVWSDYLQMAQLFGGALDHRTGDLGQLAFAPYVALRGAGLPGQAAAAVQAAITLTTLAFVCVVFRPSSGDRRGARLDLRLGILAVGALLATPYALSYDSPVLGLALIPLFVRAWRGGWAGWELAAVTALIAAPYAQALGDGPRIPFGLCALALAFGVLVRRFRLEAPAPAGASRATGRRRIAAPGRQQGVAARRP